MGAGIFLLPGKIAQAAGGWAWAVYIGCAVLCFLIALCFAEMGSRYAGTGGAYLYARAAFGPFWGFLVGWIVWLSAVLGWASVAVGLADTLPSIGLTLFESRWTRLALVAALVTALGLLNARGTRLGAVANNVFSVAKLLPLALFVVLAASHAVQSPLDSPHHWGGANDVYQVMLWALFLYSGFEEIAVPAGETRDPQRTVPTALFLVLGVATGVYLAVHVAAAAAYPALASADNAPLADAAFFIIGTGGLLLVGLGSVVSLLGTNASIAFTGPRSLFAMAESGYVSERFAEVHPTWHTPVPAIAATSALVVALPLVDLLELRSFNLETLVRLSALASLLQYVSTCAAVIVMRRKKEATRAGFHVPGGLLVPVLALAVCVALFYMSSLDDKVSTVAAVLLGLPFWWLRRNPT